MKRALMALGVVTLLSACASWSKVDPLTTVKGNGNGSVNAEVNCPKPNADGVSCNVKTCKADATSDCFDFGSKCIEYGHNYNGTSTSGTCTRTV